MGAPWEAQEGAKLEQNRSWEAFFKVEKASVYHVVFECISDRFGSPLGKQKRAFRIGEVAKIKFSGSCVLT